MFLTLKSQCMALETLQRLHDCVLWVPI